MLKFWQSFSSRKPGEFSLFDFKIRLQLLIILAKRILIIEDEVPLLKVLRDEFSDEGFTVLTARKGTTGLKLAFLHHPQVILLDVMMAKMDGLTVLHQLRADPWGSNVPVLLLTNINDPEVITESIQDRVSAYLLKADWKLEDIVQEVKKRIEP